MQYYAIFHCILDWIAKDEQNPEKAKCRYCKKSYDAHLGGLRKHVHAETHTAAVAEALKTVQDNRPITNFVMEIVDERKVAELKIAAHIAESGTAFRQSDSLINLLKSVAKKDKIVQNLTVCCLL